MVSPKSKREAVQTTAQKIFVDREAFQDSFEKALDRKPEQTYKVLVYYGVGGIGKTSLIKQLESNLESINQEAIYVSLDFGTPHFRQQDEALSKLVSLIRKKYKIEFLSYGIAYLIYWKKVHPNQKLNVKDIPLFEDSSMFADIISILADVPVVGVVPKAAKIVLKGQSFIKTWWTIRGEETLRQLESMEPQEILDELPIYFAQDLADNLNKNNRSAVIFLDSYEALWEIEKNVGHHTLKDEWVRNLIAELPYPTNILWVICGRERLRWEEIKNDNWGDYLEQHLIGYFADSDARYLLETCGIVKSELQDAIIKSSEGVPFYLDLAIEMHDKIIKRGDEPIASRFNGTHEKLLKRFLRYLDRSEKVALEVLSTARFWDRNLFDSLLTKFDTGYPRQLFSELMRYSFITEPVVGEKTVYSMHQLMRKNLQDFQDEEDRKRIDEYLFEYYSDQLPEDGAKSISEQNIAAVREAFYHKSKFTNISEFSKWFYDAAELYNIYEQYNVLIDLYQELLIMQEEALGPDHYDVAITLSKLALLYRFLGKYHKLADPLYLRSLKILDNQARLYKAQGKYDQAEPLYQRSLKTSERFYSSRHTDVANTLYNLASLNQLQGKYDEAEPMLLQAFKIYEEAHGHNRPVVATILNSLARLYQAQGKYDEAEHLFKRVLKIRKVPINCFECSFDGEEFYIHRGIRAENDLDNDQLIVNGLGNIRYISNMEIKTVDGSINKLFRDVNDIWLGEIDGQVYIFRAEIELSNNFIIPVDEKPGYSNSRYIKLLCKNDDDVTIQGGGRIISRVFTREGQMVYLETIDDSVIQVALHGKGTATFKCTEEKFAEEENK